MASELRDFGEYEMLDTVHYLFGMEVGEETMVDIEDGKTLVLKLLATGELSDEGSRRGYFELNGQPREVIVIDRSVETTVDRRPKADRTNPNHVGASMQGKVLQVLVKSGDAVDKGAVLMTTEAMKMETSITAPRAGVVDRVEAEVGVSVLTGDLVVTLK